MLYLEVHTSLDLLIQDIRNDLIERVYELDGELRLDAALRNKVVERVCEGRADAGVSLTVVLLSFRAIDSPAATVQLVILYRTAAHLVNSSWITVMSMRKWRAELRNIESASTG